MFFATLQPVHEAKKASLARFLEGECLIKFFFIMRLASYFLPSLKQFLHQIIVRPVVLGVIAALGFRCSVRLSSFHNIIYASSLPEWKVSSVPFEVFLLHAFSILILNNLLAMRTEDFLTNFNSWTSGIPHRTDF